MGGPKCEEGGSHLGHQTQVLDRPLAQAVMGTLWVVAKTPPDAHR